MSAQAFATFKPLTARGRGLGDAETPAICMPLIGSSRESLLVELKSLTPLRPDVFEWRADHFEALASLETVTDSALSLRRALGETPLIFTLRAQNEGGASQTLDPSAALQLVKRMAQSTLFDFVDLELAAGGSALRDVIDLAHQAGTQVIVSSHDFSTTPPSDELVDRLRRAKSLGADVAKLAVMPSDPSDVLRLMEVTREARRELDMPLVTMAMGPLGVASRAVGHLFGSSMTFASGLSTSAPGQLSIVGLREIFNILRSKNLPR